MSEMLYSLRVRTLNLERSTLGYKPTYLFIKAINSIIQNIAIKTMITNRPYSTINYKNYISSKYVTDVK